MNTSDNNTKLFFAAPIMRHELRRFAFSERQRTLASLILSLTWEEAIPAVRVPELKFFTLMTGMAASHVSTTLSQLHELMRVVIITEQEGGNLYAINPETAEWQVTPRTSRAALTQAVNLVRELNGVPLQTEAALNFKIQDAASFVRIGATKLVSLPERKSA